MIDVQQVEGRRLLESSGPRLRILILHSRYRSGPVSGENRVVDDEARLLQLAGHEVSMWAPSVADSNGAALAAGAGVLWSPRAVRSVRRLIDDHAPDVVHLHNLFPLLSPAVIRVASESAAVVMTLHNYRLLCLPGVFFRDGKPCEACLGRVPWRGVVHACYRGSALGSAAVAGSLTLHGRLGTFDRVDRFLAVSEFVRAKYVEAGFPPHRIEVRPNFAWGGPRREGPGEWFVYAGRLSPEKGLETLLAMWRSDWPPLIVVGEGPIRGDLERAAPGNVEFLGSVAPTEVSAVLRRARALLVPSRSFEANPRTILEAYALGVPVIGSRLGGVEEAIEHGVSGLLVQPNDLTGWAGGVERVLLDEESERLGHGAWQRWHDRYSPERGLEALEKAYAAARRIPE